jgi:hypothetical protein
MRTGIMCALVTSVIEMSKMEDKMITIHGTRYFGIYKQYEEQGWFLTESRYGTSVWFDHEPTEAEIDEYRNHVAE